jgi:hypothetical protein
VTTREAALHRAQRPSATVLRERDDRRPPRRDPRPIRNQLDEDPVANQDAAPRAAEVADLLRREQEQLRDALAEPDVSFIVTPVAAEAHFVRDHDGEVRPAGEVERERARPRREFGVDVVQLPWRRFNRRCQRSTATTPPTENGARSSTRHRCLGPVCRR